MTGLEQGHSVGQDNGNIASQVPSGPIERVFVFPDDFNHPTRIESIRESGIAYGKTLSTPSLFTNGGQDLPKPEDMKTFVREVVEMGDEYNDRVEVELISPEDLLIGEEIFEFWQNEFQRPKPQFRSNGIIYVTSSHLESDPRDNSDEEPKIKKLRKYEIVEGVRLADIAQEEIPDEFARAIFQFLEVERNLPEYSEQGGVMYRHIRGMSRSHPQWSEEEGVHDDDLSAILENASDWTPQALAQAYNVNLLRKWTPPFKKARQMLIYAMFQEKQTNLQYKGLRLFARANGAPNTAKALGYVEGDEQFHHRFFRGVVGILAKHDLQGTIADIVYVVRNYYMPALNLVSDSEEATKLAMSDLRAVGAFPKGLLRRDVILGVLQQLEKDSVLPKGMAKIIESAFAHRPRRTPSEAPKISHTVFDATTNTETTTVFTKPRTPKELAELQPVD